MSWANNVLPRFIGVSGESEARRLPHRKFAVQIGDIKKTSECHASTWFQAHGFRFNRTLLIAVVILCIKTGNDENAAISPLPKLDVQEVVTDFLNEAKLAAIEAWHAAVIEQIICAQTSRVQKDIS